MENHELNQAAFDKVVRHLLEQGRKSLRSDNSTVCLYRGPDGLACAVGCLIPDAEYSPQLEGLTVDLMFAFNKEPPSLKGLNVKLLSTLQSVHDAGPVCDWAARLQRAAELFGLTMPDLEA